MFCAKTSGKQANDGLGSEGIAIFSEISVAK
jgi:hypothetical protein